MRTLDNSRLMFQTVKALIQPLTAIVLCAGTVLVAPPVRAATNVLTNPGFETGNATGWTTTGNVAINSTNDLVYIGSQQTTASNVMAHAGEFVYKTWGPSGGYSVGVQEIAASAGSVWTADGWVYSADQDKLGYGSSTWLEVQFLDATSTQLGFYRSYLLNDPANTDGLLTNYWYHLVVTNEYDPLNLTTPTNSVTAMVAPAGTVKVHLAIVVKNTGNWGSCYWDDLALVKVAGSDPDISASPSDQLKAVGQSVSFTVSAAGATTLHYQWYKDGTTALANGGNISGATSATLTVANISLADAGQYTCAVSDNNGSITSGAAKLTVVTVDEASNVLLNRDFETGVDAPWTRFNGGGLVTAIPGGEPMHGGNYASEFWGNGVGSWNGIFQDIKVTPGQSFTADGWFLVSSGAPIAGDSQSWLEVQFMNGSGNMIGLYQSDHIRSNTVQSTWLHLEATNILAFWSDYSVVGQTKYLTAPAGAAKVRFQINYHAADGGGAVFADDLNLFLKIPVAVKLSGSGSSRHLAFPTQLGVGYQVLYKNDLSDATWQVLATPTGDLTGQVSISDSSSATRRFYRVTTL